LPRQAGGGMKLRWMPLDVADYRADTAHLGALEHGVYLLLIMHYWQTGSLPDDDEKLARICCCTRTEFRRVRSTVEAFFLPGWKHKRIEQELEKARKISEKRSLAAEEKHALAAAPPHANADASAEQVHTPLPSPLPSPSKNINLLGEVKCDEPRNGLTANGRIYVRKGSTEWESYAEDYRAARGCEPNVNASGGRWFKILGEQAV
jgi:uncharacterized protein YdaU (DUF1376 family)